VATSTLKGGVRATHELIEFVSAADKTNGVDGVRFYYPGVLLGDDKYDVGESVTRPTLLNVPSMDVEKGLISITVIGTSEGTVTVFGQRFFVKLA
jgi:hypothetical protein